MTRVLIVGGGPAGLMAAHTLSTQNNLLKISVYDANKALARKFLVAGHGGFNLTNNKDLDEFVQEYDHPLIQQAVRDFDNEATVSWLSDIGIPTYVGSSGKVFPEKGIKPIEVLNHWIAYLKERQVEFYTEHFLTDFHNNKAIFSTSEGNVEESYDFIIFALGGASWSKTGSSGAWLDLFLKKDIACVPFAPSNSGIEITNWKDSLEGNVLKNVEVSIGNQTRFGEIELTNYGLEGAPIYALSKEVRNGCTTLAINFKPTMNFAEIQNRFDAFRGNKTEFLKSLKLNTGAIQMMKTFLSKEEFMSDALFLKSILHFVLPIHALRPIDEVISTVGGIDMDAVNKDFELKQVPQHFCVGEMLDWDAPTGGYLLQACFASGVVAAKSILNKVSLV